MTSNTAVGAQVSGSTPLIRISGNLFFVFCLEPDVTHARSRRFPRQNGPRNRLRRRHRCSGTLAWM